jgi:hypothetical protein
VLEFLNECLVVYKANDKLKSASEIIYYTLSGRHICFVDSILLSKPGSSVSIVSGYRMDDQAIKVRSPAEAKEFFL